MTNTHIALYVHTLHHILLFPAAIRSVPRPAPKRHTTKKKQTTAAVEPTVVHGGKAEKVGAAAGGVVKKAGGGKGGGRRRRTSSSGSLSEDDVFVITEVQGTLLLDLSGTFSVSCLALLGW